MASSGSRASSRFTREVDVSKKFSMPALLKAKEDVIALFQRLDNPTYVQILSATIEVYQKRAKEAANELARLDALRGRGMVSPGWSQEALQAMRSRNKYTEVIGALLALRNLVLMMIQDDVSLEGDATFKRNKKVRRR